MKCRSTDELSSNHVDLHALFCERSLHCQHTHQHAHFTVNNTLTSYSLTHSSTYSSYRQHVHRTANAISSSRSLCHQYTHHAHHIHHTHHLTNTQLPNHTLVIIHHMSYRMLAAQLSFVDHILFYNITSLNMCR